MQAAAAMAALPLGDPKAKAAELTGDVKLSMPGGDLEYMQQLGVEWVTMPGPGAPTYSEEGRVIQRPNSTASPNGPWKEEEIRAIKDRIEAAGLKLGNMMLHDFRDVILGRPGRDRDIENVQQSIRVAGRVGLPVVEYNFYALRAMGGYYRKPGRGGVEYAAHDFDRAKDLPVLPDIGEHHADALWERYEYFLKAVVPVAVEAGVRLAVHPNDPPPPRFRGCDQIIGSVEGLKRVVDIVRSPANGITLDTGVTREMGHNPIEVIEYFGKRDQINHVHFRNVITEVPRLKYTEVFLEEGQVDMLAALKALRAVKYPRLLYPDHVPSMPGDDRNRAGWAYAVGHIKALMRQAG